MEDPNLNSSPANPLLGLLDKHPLIKPVIGILVLVLFVGVAFVLRSQSENVQPNYSSADCYGTDCTPSVTIGGRTIPYGYDRAFTYGTLYIRRGQSIELTWFGNNVDTCKAVNGWTNFTGVYLPPTLYERRLKDSDTISVKCYRGKREVIAGSLNVIVEAPR